MESELSFNVISEMHRQNKYITAICDAPKILAKLDIIKNCTVTSYPSEEETVSAKAMRYSKNNVVVDGKIVTSRGPGTAMEFSFILLDILKGKEVSQQVREQILFLT